MGKFVIDHQPVLDLDIIPVPDLIDLTYRVINENTDLPDEFRKAVTALNGQLDEAHQHPNDERVVCIAFLRIYGGA